MEVEIDISLNNLTLRFIPKLIFSHNFNRLVYDIFIRMPKNVTCALWTIYLLFVHITKRGKETGVLVDVETSGLIL